MFSVTACSDKYPTLDITASLSVDPSESVSELEVISGTLRLWAQEPISYDPLEFRQIQWKTMTGLFYEGLYSIDSNQRVADDLAISDSVSDNGLIHEIEIHNGVYFHDGSLLDAGDIIYSFDRIKGSVDSPYKHLLDNVTDISLLDDHKIMLRLEKPDPFLKHRLTFPVIPLPEEDITSEYTFFPPGTGPYKILRSEQGDIKAQIFGGYRFSDDHMITDIRINILRNTLEAMYSLGNDETDIVFLDDEMYSAFYLRRDIDIHRFPGRTYLFFQMNLNDDSILAENHRNDKIRSIARSEIFLEGLKDSLIIPSDFPFIMTSGLVHTYNCGHYLSSAETSDFPDTNKPLHIIYSEPDMIEVHLIRRLHEELAKEKIRFTTEELDKAEFENALINGDYDIALRNCVTDGTPDPAWLYLAEMYPVFANSLTLTSNVGTPFKVFQSKLLESYIVSYKGSFADNNCEILNVMNAQGPFIGIGYKVNALAASKRIKGDPGPNIFDPYNNIEDVWVWLGY